MSFKTYFKLARIKSFIKYCYNKIGLKYGLINLEVSSDEVKAVDPEEVAWKSEAIVFRGLMCPPCKEQGKCVSCGCSWNGISQDMTLECDMGNWPEVKSKQHWEELKEKFRINIGLVPWRYKSSN